MTTVDGTTSLPRFLVWKLAKAMDKRARTREATERTHTQFQTIMRLLLHIAGFASLTIAGFAFNFIAGMIVLGICCFVMSTLLTTNRGGQ